MGRGKTRRRGLYRKVPVQLYGDSRWPGLSAAAPNAQTLLIYLMTAAHTTPVPGFFSLGIASLAESIRWPVEPLRERFLELVQQKFAEGDWTARVVWMPDVLFDNEPSNQNVVKGWFPYIDAVPDCQLKTRVIHALYSYLRGRGPKFSEPFLKWFRKPLAEPLLEPLPERYAKQEEDEDEEEDEERNPPPTPRAARGGRGTRALRSASSGRVAPLTVEASPGEAPEQPPGPGQQSQRGTVSPAPGEPDPAPAPAPAPPAARRRRGRRPTPRQLSAGALAVQAAISEVVAVTYPPEAFDALEDRLEGQGLALSGEAALRVLRYAARDEFWCGKLRLDPTKLFGTANCAGLLGRADAAARRRAAEPPPPPAAPSPPMPPLDPSSTWGRARTLLAGNLPPEAMAGWVDHVRELGVAGDELLLGVPNLYVRDHVLDQWGPELRSAIDGAAGRALEVRWELYEVPVPPAEV